MNDNKPQGAVPRTARPPRTDPLVELRGAGKSYGNIRAPARCRPHGPRRPGHLRARRQRRREVHPHQDHLGAAPAHRGRVPRGRHPVRFSTPREALDKGIATVYQDLATVPLMPVWRNFFLGSEMTKGPWPVRRLDIARMKGRPRTRSCATWASSWTTWSSPSAPLSGGQRQCVAIARAVYFGARVLILDEPTAALGVKQSGVVLKYIAAARDRGLGVIFITHNPHHAYMVGDHFQRAAPRHPGTECRTQRDRPRRADQPHGGRRRTRRASSTNWPRCAASTWRSCPRRATSPHPWPPLRRNVLTCPTPSTASGSARPPTPGASGSLTTRSRCPGNASSTRSPRPATTGSNWARTATCPPTPARLTEEVARRGLKVSAGTVFTGLHRGPRRLGRDLGARRPGRRALTQAMGARHLVVIPSFWRDDKTAEILEPPELTAEQWAHPHQGAWSVSATRSGRGTAWTSSCTRTPTPTSTPRSTSSASWTRPTPNWSTCAWTPGTTPTAAGTASS